MPLFKKDVIKPGKYNVAGNTIVINRQDIDNWHSTFHAMKDAGLSVPVPFEHPDRFSQGQTTRFAEGKPTLDTRKYSAQDRSKNNAGWVKDMEIAADGSLVATLDIPNKDYAAKFQDGTHKFVSPEFGGTFTDERGVQWINPITHVAVTPRPVNRDQQAFIALSVKEGIGPVQFSLKDMIRFGMPPKSGKPKVPVDTDGDGAPDAETDGEDGDMNGVPDDMEGQESSEMPEMPEEGMEGGQEDTDYQASFDDAGRIPQIVESLAMLGVPLPEDTDESNFLDRLYTALGIAAEHAQQNQMPMQGMQGQEHEESPAMIAMSRAQQQRLDENNRRVVRMSQALEKSQREKWIGEAETLTKRGQMRPVTLTALKGLAAQYRFSEEATNVNEIRVNDQLETARNTPPGTYLSEGERTRMSMEAERSQRVSGHSPDGDLDEDEVDAIVNEQFHRSGNRTARTVKVS